MGMSNRRELHAYDYVNRPYEAVRDALLADPGAVLQQGAELHAAAGPLDVGARVTIEVVGIETEATFKPTTKVTLAWKAERHPGLFPTMRGVLSIYALTPTETQLDFAGTYDPPLGVIGDAVDTVAMQGLAKSSIDGFVRDLAAALR